MWHLPNVHSKNPNSKNPIKQKIFQSRKEKNYETCKKTRQRIVGIGHGILLGHHSIRRKRHK